MSDMLTAVKDLDLAQKAVIRAYELILTWPCPKCGGSFPCPCNKADALRLKNKSATIRASTDTAPVLAAPARPSQSDQGGTGPKRF
jgi:hypothetical protein